MISMTPQGWNAKVLKVENLKKVEKSVKGILILLTWKICVIFLYFFLYYKDENCAEDSKSKTTLADRKESRSSLDNVKSDKDSLEKKVGGRNFTLKMRISNKYK